MLAVIFKCNSYLQSDELVSLAVVIQNLANRREGDFIQEINNMLRQLGVFRANLVHVGALKFYVTLAALQSALVS